MHTPGQALILTDYDAICPLFIEKGGLFWYTLIVHFPLYGRTYHVNNN